MRIKMRHFIFFSLSLLLVLPGTSIAQTCSGLYSEKKVPSRRVLESAVEVEISAEVIAPFMTTTDGTIRPVADRAGIEAIPENILKEIRDNFPEIDPLDLDWDLLTSFEKQEIIMLSAKKRDHQFSQSRTIPGLVYRDEIDLTFAKASRFMGKDYAPGSYRFKTKDIFKSTAIEYMGPNRMTENLGVEIHIRTNLGAEENYKSSRTLQMAMTGRINNVHQHVVGRLPIKKMSESPERMASLMTEFIRRQLLKVQFARIRDAQPVEINRSEEGVLNMPVTTRSDFTNLYSHFLKLGQSLQRLTDGIQNTRARNQALQSSLLAGLLRSPVAKKLGLKPLEPKKINTEIGEVSSFSRKMGLIGVRSYQVYDGSPWQWGIEFRDLTAHRNLESQISILKSAQEKLASQNYGINDSSLGKLSAGELYFPDSKTYLDKAADLGRNFPFISILNDPILAAEIKKSCQENEYNTALNILFHNWAIDPIVDGHLPLINQIEQTREIALKRLAKGESSNTVLQFFIKRSGLDYRLSQL
jgi:hypothetical protein